MVQDFYKLTYEPPGKKRKERMRHITYCGYNT